MHIDRPSRLQPMLRTSFLLVVSCIPAVFGVKWDLLVDVCHKDTRLDSVLLELSTGISTAIALAEDPERAPQVDSPSMLFVRIPDEAAVGLFCAAVGCYAHCADWMLAAYPSVSAGARGLADLDIGFLCRKS
jgi:hypothetical protein